MPDEALRAELLAMAAEDRTVRARLAAEGSLFQGYHPEMEAVHTRNARRLAALIAERGWPGRALAREDGAAAAWLIVQHAIGHPDLQRQTLALLQGASARRDVPAAQVALLEDRIRFFEGRPQRYGTQHDWDERGELVPWTIEDPDRVDERRRAVGLGPLSEQTARLWAELADVSPPTPEQVRARRREQARWAERVGWRRAGEPG